MLIPQINKNTCQLLQKIGNGLQWFGQDSSLKITFCQHKEVLGAGLVLHATLSPQGQESRTLDLWIDEQQWCQWVSAVLTVPSLEMTPPDLKALLALWTLEEADVCRDENPVPWPVAKSLEQGTWDSGLYWHLSLTRNERQLDMFLLPGEEAWLQHLIGEASPVISHEDVDDIAATCSLLAGWSKLPQSSLAGLQPGDALLLQTQWDVAAGQFGLFIDQPLATLRQDSEADYFIVEDVMDNFDDWMDVTPAAIPATEGGLTTATITVTVEVTQLQTTLLALSSISPGSMLTGNTAWDGLVTLKVAGRPIARGTLLDVDSQLAVRIEQLC